jgi:microcompartment protein CcmK/EutM
VRLCRVVGTVVATVKHPAFAGHKLLLCQPVDGSGKDEGDAVIAVDRAQSGVGDTVLVMSEGNGARQMLGTLDGKLPVRSVIVAHVDEVALS